MKDQKKLSNKKFYNKIFIKICRIFGYEIIDQSTYEVPTLNKELNETLSIPGKNSVTIPLGKLQITRRVKSLKIISIYLHKKLLT